MEFIIFLIIVVAVIIGCKAWVKRSREERKEMLLQKYNDPEIVEMIIKRTMWQGQTKEQLLDSLGSPDDIDTKVYKTKSKEIYKYHPTGKNRYSLKITIEDGEVVGWDQK